MWKVLTLETRMINDHIELVVKDTGSGIDQDKLANLFTPFFTTKTHGTGLGLPLCLSIVERHNGTIRVESVTGKARRLRYPSPMKRKKETLPYKGKCAVHSLLSQGMYV